MRVGGLGVCTVSSASNSSGPPRAYPHVRRRNAIHTETILSGSAIRMYCDKEFDAPTEQLFGSPLSISLKHAYSLIPATAAIGTRGVWPAP